MFSKTFNLICGLGNIFVGVWKFEGSTLDALSIIIGLWCIVEYIVQTIQEQREVKP